MKVLKFILFTIVGLITIALIAAAFMPSSYQVERSIVVDATPQQCYDNVSNLKHFRQWNPWSLSEPTAEQIVHEPHKGLNAKWSWNGEMIGQGSLTIVKVEEGKSMNTHLKFLKPFESESDGSWKFEATEGGTKITWGNKGDLAYPIARFMGSGIEEMLGKDFEEGLGNLKEYILKNKPVAPAVSDSTMVAQDSISSPKITE